MSSLDEWPVSEEEIEWIRCSSGSQAHKARLLGHLLRIRSDPAFEEHEPYRLKHLHQKKKRRLKKPRPGR